MNERQVVNYLRYQIESFQWVEAAELAEVFHCSVHQIQALSGDPEFRKRTDRRWTDREQTYVDLHGLNHPRGVEAFQYRAKYLCEVDKSGSKRKITAPPRDLQKDPSAHEYILVF